MRKRLASTILTGMAAVALLLSPFPAYSQSSGLTDPVGDFGFILPDSVNPQPYQDVVRAEITKRGGIFLFVMRVAGAIPDRPALPPGVKEMFWDWALDTNPDTFPAGFPDPPGIVGPSEFFVEVIWDGTSFTARLIDRRPLLVGQEATITPLSFKIKGAEITAVVDESLLGDPTSFEWPAFTGVLWGLDWSFGVFLTDFAGFATWTAN